MYERGQRNFKYVERKKGKENPQNYKADCGKKIYALHSPELIEACRNKGYACGNYHDRPSLPHGIWNDMQVDKQVQEPHLKEKQAKQNQQPVGERPQPKEQEQGTHNDVDDNPRCDGFARSKGMGRHQEDSSDHQ